MHFKIEKAKFEDRPAIIKVLEPWNMHHIPSPEAEEMDLSCFVVAKVDEKIVGVAGYKLLSRKKAKLRLLAVYPEFQGEGIGKALKNTRLELLHSLGIKKLVINCDRPEIIAWYKKHYHYYEIGTLAKVSSHGLDSVDNWITLEMDIASYFTNEIKK